MINLLTPDRVVFKACVGKTKGDSLERNGSFCDVAVSQESPYAVIDASKDSMFKDYILITDEHVRSYLGKSLHAPDGTRIGTFCVLDHKPRNYSKVQHKLLTDTAASIENEIASLFSTLGACPID